VHLKDGVTKLSKVSHALRRIYKNKHLFSSTLIQILLIDCSCQSLDLGIQNLIVCRIGMKIILRF